MSQKNGTGAMCFFILGFGWIVLFLFEPDLAFAVLFSVPWPDCLSLQKEKSEKISRKILSKQVFWRRSFMFLRPLAPGFGEISGALEKIFPPSSQ